MTSQVQCTGMLWFYPTDLAIAVIISYIMQLQRHLTWTNSE